MSFDVEPAATGLRGNETGGGGSGSGKSVRADGGGGELTGDLAGGSGSAPPPPWTDGGSYGAAAMPTTDAVADRASLMSHWVDDFAMPRLDVQSLIGDLSSKLTLDPNDKSKSLELLNQAAGTKKEEAYKQVAAEETKLEQHEAEGKEQVHQQAKKQLQQVKGAPHGTHEKGELGGQRGGGPGPEQHGPGHKLSPQVCGPITRDSLRQRVEETMARELAELDANYAKEQGRLESKIETKLDDLSAEKQKQEGKVGARLGKGEVELKGDIAKRAGKHADEIAKEQKTIDAEAATQNKSLGDQGATDKLRAEAEQKNQADQTKAFATKRAADIRARSSSEGSHALTNASARGKQLTDAATTRAAKVPEGERAPVTTDGKQRNTTALLEGQKRQQQIQVKGESDAKATLDEGKRASDAMARGGKPGATYSDQIGASTKAGTARVDGAAKKANADMKAVSSQAVGNMDAAVEEAKKKGGEKSGEASTTMAHAETDAKVAAEKEKTTALAKMKASYESTRSRIESRAKEELAKINKAPANADLCKLEKQISGDLKSMEKMAERADEQMAGQVKLAERKVAADVAKKKGVMRQAAHKAVGAIDGFLVQARQKIKAADKNTLKDIQASGKLGQQAVADTGKQALADATKRNDDIVKKIGTDGAKDRAAIDTQAKASEEAMAKTAAETKDAIDQQVINDTLAIAGQNIQDKPWYDWTSDSQANTALNALTSLPKDLQGKAIEKLPAEQFKNLLTEVPEQRREEFESLVEATTDPERKLQLWAVYAKSKAHNDANRMKGDTGHWWSRSKDQADNDKKNDIRQNVANTTDKEIDEEVAHLRELQKNGTPLTKEAVTELYERKKLESQVEMKYAVNLTNDVDSGKADDPNAPPTQRRTWSKQELEQLDSVVGRLPEEHRDALKTIRRSGVDQDWNQKTKQWQNGSAAAYMTAQGEMRYFDSGIKGSMRHTGGGETDFQGNPITALQENFPHELGHSVENLLRDKGKGDIVDRFYKAAGWENLSEAEVRARMAKQGLDTTKTDAEIKALNDQRKDGIVKPYYSRTAYTGTDGKLYEIDPYGGGFLAVNQDAMPDRFSGGTAAQDNHWGYARSNQRDHFAETYMMAVHTPQTLYQDLVGEPTKARDQAQSQLTAAKDAVKTASTPEEKRLAEEAEKKAKENLDKANATVTSRGDQWSIMRNEINGTDKVETKAKSELEGIATNPANSTQRKEIMKHYEEEAAQLATPEQINLLKAKYQTQLEALK